LAQRIVHTFYILSLLLLPPWSTMEGATPRKRLR
jgi:hypothetical protein